MSGYLGAFCVVSLTGITSVKNRSASASVNLMSKAEISTIWFLTRKGEREKGMSWRVRITRCRFGGVWFSKPATISMYHPGSDALVVIYDEVQIIRETADVLYEARNKLFLREEPAHEDRPRVASKDHHLPKRLARRYCEKRLKSLSDLSTEYQARLSSSRLAHWQAREVLPEPATPEMTMRETLVPRITCREGASFRPSSI